MYGCALCTIQVLALQVAETRMHERTQGQQYARVAG